MKNRFSILLIFVFMPLFLQAFSLFEKEAPESREGRKKYAVGEMAEAENEFDKAAKRLENNAEAYYDLGNALQSQQKFEEALNAYQKSLETGKTTENLRSKIFHNMGNSFAGLGKYQDAEKFYMKSLEEEPSKESAENLEIVRRIIEQQQEQEEQQKQQQEKQDKQENQDQQDQENQEQNQEEKEKQDEKEQNENP
ncbi:tetratricopeptide repeat protein, partial [bacterium]|nr:tetratricopeptide repeat protein [bacterium]